MNRLEREMISMAVPHRTAARSTRRTRSARTRWIVAWLGVSGLAIANGVAREGLYGEAVGDQAAHQISTVTLLVMIAGYAWLLQRLWPLTSSRTAWQVGAAWVAMTVAFEFGFGHYVTGNSWSALLADYNILEGRLWLIIPLAMLLAPELVRRTAPRSDS